MVYKIYRTHLPLPLSHLSLSLLSLPPFPSLSLHSPSVSPSLSPPSSLHPEGEHVSGATEESGPGQDSQCMQRMGKRGRSREG